MGIFGNRWVCLIWMIDYFENPILKRLAKGRVNNLFLQCHKIMYLKLGQHSNYNFEPHQGSQSLRPMKIHFYTCSKSFLWAVILVRFTDRTGEKRETITCSSSSFHLFSQRTCTLKQVFKHSSVCVCVCVYRSTVYVLTHHHRATLRIWETQKSHVASSVIFPLPVANEGARRFGLKLGAKYMTAAQILQGVQRIYSFYRK